MADPMLRSLYLADYFASNTDEDHPASIAQIADYLKDKEIKVSRQTLYNDIRFLNEYGLDIQSVKGKGTFYFLGDRDFQLVELKALIDVVQASPFLSQNKSMELISKLTKLSSKEQAKELKRQVYVMNRPKTENEKLYYTIDGINNAINNNLKVSFHYFDYTVTGEKAYRHNDKVYITNPVALCVDRFYYLVAYDSELKYYRHYRLDRMEQLTVEKAARDPLPANFDLGNYVKTFFDMYSGESTLVQMRFENHLLNSVIDKFGFHENMHADGEKHFIITVKVDVGPTFYGWIFQFGSGAEILGPKHIRDEFSMQIIATNQNYKKDD